MKTFAQSLYLGSFVPWERGGVMGFKDEYMETE